MGLFCPRVQCILCICLAKSHDSLRVVSFRLLTTVILEVRSEETPLMRMRELNYSQRWTFLFPNLKERTAAEEYPSRRSDLEDLLPFFRTDLTELARTRNQYPEMRNPTSSRYVPWQWSLFQNFFFIFILFLGCWLFSACSKEQFSPKLQHSLAFYF